jgi:14-3-3 protein epsilon
MHKYQELFFYNYKRTAWRALSSIEQKEEGKGSKYISLLRQQKKQIEGELNVFCGDILKLIDEQIMPHASNSEYKVNFFTNLLRIYLYLFIIIFMRTFIIIIF